MASNEFDGTVQRPTDPEAAAAAGTMTGIPVAERDTSAQSYPPGEEGLTEDQVLGREPLDDEDV